jgi:catechol 2,3-dioxygenase-like lactoylglutathione lyase family enzyme
VSGPALDRLDHLVLTVRDVEATCALHGRALGMEAVTFGPGRLALRFGAPDDLEPLRDWLRRLQSCVRAVDCAGGRGLAVHTHFSLTP